MIEISGGFVMQNPAQIKKSIKGISGASGFPLGEISGYTDKAKADITADSKANMQAKTAAVITNFFLFVKQEEKPTTRATALTINPKVTVTK